MKPEKERLKRKLLGELSQNTIQLAAGRDRIRPKQYPKGLYGCQLCAVYVCRKGVCWSDHVRAI